MPKDASCELGLFRGGRGSRVEPLLLPLLLLLLVDLLQVEVVDALPSMFLTSPANITGSSSVSNELI